MVVEILHERGGYDLDPEVDSRRQLDKLVLVNFHDFLPLKEHEYNLTEISAITDSEYNYWLIVMENGIGFRRDIPCVIPDLSKGIEGVIGLRGRTIEISQPDQIIVVSIFLPNTGRTRVYDIIRFRPGPSPR
jgi:hypothetical protein